MSMELWQQHEAWSEQAAKFCDQMVDDYLRIAADWQTKADTFGARYTANARLMAYECNLRATVYQRMADYHRQGRRAREESEQYRSAQP